VAYSCKNHHPRNNEWPPFQVKEGVDWDGKFIMGWHFPKWREGECQHDRSDEDPGCDGCRWRVEG
jgi:hypothetical protein